MSKEKPEKAVYAAGKLTVTKNPDDVSDSYKTALTTFIGSKKLTDEQIGSLLIAIAQKLGVL